MKKLVVTMSIALLAAASFGGTADARPGKGRGHAYGHYKHHRPAYGYVVPRRHRNNNAAIAAGITGAIIGGALSATTQPTYRRYSRPAYGYYSSPRRTYYREEYYDYGY